MMAELDPLSGSRYQHDYRITHPEYTSTNRQKQQVRNSGTKAGRSPETKIVNPDALMLQTPDNDRIYAMIAVDNKMIVNPDAFVKECIDMEQIAKVKPMLVRLL